MLKQDLETVLPVYSWYSLLSFWPTPSVGEGRRGVEVEEIIEQLKQLSNQSYDIRVVVRNIVRAFAPGRRDTFSNNIKL